MISVLHTKGGENELYYGCVVLFICFIITHYKDNYVNESSNSIKVRNIIQTNHILMRHETRVAKIDGAMFSILICVTNRKLT